MLLILGVAAAAVMYAPAGALGAFETIVAASNPADPSTPFNKFSKTVYTMDQGERPLFQNLDSNQHNVTAVANGPDGKVLFNTPTIGTGTTSLKGTQYLTTGTYSFICTLHPATMAGTLAVSANGIPVPRPTLVLTLLSKKIEKVLKNGLLVRMDVGTKADDMTLEARLGNTLIGKVEDISQATGTSFIKVKLNKAGKSRLRKRKKATIALSGTVPDGAPTTSTGKLK